MTLVTKCPCHPATLLSLSAIAAHFGLVLWWIFTAFVVVDESAQLGAGLATWRTGDTRPYCVNPPVPRLIATLPVWAAGADIAIAPGDKPGFRSEWPLAVSLARDNSGRYLEFVRIARLANLVWDV